MLGLALATPVGRSASVGSEPPHPARASVTRRVAPAASAVRGAGRTAYVLSFIVTLNA
jgi:hypothetical protein